MESEDDRKGHEVLSWLPWQQQNQPGCTLPGCHPSHEVARKHDRSRSLALTGQLSTLSFLTRTLALTVMPIGSLSLGPGMLAFLRRSMR